MHNDLKGDNVLVDLDNGLEESPVVNIIDFGMANRVGDYLGLNPDPALAIAANHMAPELWAGAASTTVTDSYSLGILFD